MVDATDVIEKEDIRATAEMEDERNNYFRQAFRQLDATDTGGSQTFPELTEENEIQEADIVEVPEGAEYPQADFDYGEQVLVFAKYGVAVSISDEAVEDSAVSVVLDGQQNLLKTEARRMDSIAYEVLDAAAQNSGQGDGGGSLSFDEVIDARAWHKTDSGGNNDPDLCFVEPLGAASLLKELKDRHTQSGDEAARTGQIGGVAGLSIIEADTGHLPAHNALLVDSDNFGFESVKHQKEVEEVRQGLQDKTVWKVSDRLGWIATDGEAAAMVEG